MAKVQGSYFNGEASSKRVSVDVEFLDRGIKFIDANESHYWNASDLSVQKAGAQDHLLMFSKMKADGQANLSEVLYVDLNADLKKWISQQGGSLSESLRKHNKMQISPKYLAALFLLGLIAFLVSLFLYRAEISTGLVQKIPFEYEKKFGDMIAKKMIPRYSQILDKDALHELEELLKPLIANLPKEYQNPMIYIANDAQMNAFAMPGGHIIFNVGALEKMESASELWGVAAHELSHVTAKHTLRKIIQSVGVFGLFQLIIGDYSGVIAVLFDQGAFLMSMSFSRDFEDEADQLGFDLLVKSGMDPRGMAGFFKQLDAENSLINDAKIEKALSYVSTHPDTKSRIEVIEKKYDLLDESIRSKLISDHAGFKRLKDRLIAK